MTTNRSGLFIAVNFVLIISSVFHGFENPHKISIIFFLPLIWYVAPNTFQTDYNTHQQFMCVLDSTMINWICLAKTTFANSFELNPAQYAGD